MAGKEVISSKLTSWYVNLFTVMPNVVTYIPAMLYLYSLMEINLLGECSSIGSGQKMAKVCSSKGRTDCLSILKLCEFTRHSIAHGNETVIVRMRALKRAVRDKGCKVLGDELRFLIGDFADLISVEALYKAIIEVELNWEPVLGSSYKVIAETFKREEVSETTFVSKMKQLEEQLREID